MMMNNIERIYNTESQSMHNNNGGHYLGVNQKCERNDFKQKNFFEKK